VRPVASEFRLIDVGSLNGTYANRELVQTTQLQNGDEIEIGKSDSCSYGADDDKPHLSMAGPAGATSVAIATRRSPELSAVVMILKAIATQPDRQYALVRPVKPHIRLRRIALGAMLRGQARVR
jgi:hypothetical protein